MLPTLSRVALYFLLLLPLGCAIQHLPEAPTLSPPTASASAASIGSSRIEVAFSPEAGNEALDVKVVGSAHQCIRLAGHSFILFTEGKSLIVMLSQATRHDVRISGDITLRGRA